MKLVTYNFAVVLIALGLIAFFGWQAIGASKQSFTSLGPSIIGALMVTGGLIATKKKALGMHIAVIAAFLGVLSIGRVFAAGFDFSQVSTKLITATSVICLIYVILAVRSFVGARRA